MLLTNEDQLKASLGVGVEIFRKKPAESRGEQTFSQNDTARKMSIYGVFYCPYFPVFGLNTEKNVQKRGNTDQKKLRIWTLFTQCENVFIKIYNIHHIYCLANLFPGILKRPKFQIV